MIIFMRNSLRWIKENLDLLTFISDITSTEHKRTCRNTFIFDLLLTHILDTYVTQYMQLEQALILIIVFHDCKNLLTLACIRHLPGAFLMISLSASFVGDLASTTLSRAFILFFCSCSSSSTLKKPAQ